MSEFLRILSAYDCFQTLLLTPKSEAYIWENKTIIGIASPNFSEVCQCQLIIVS